MTDKIKLNQQLQNSCNICTLQFDLNNHISFIICPAPHTLCLECIKRLTYPFKCPYCRKDIDHKQISIHKGMAKALADEPEMIESLSTIKFRKYKRKLIVEPESGDPQLQDGGEFMVRMVDKMNSYVIPLIYALQVFSFVLEVTLECMQGVCLDKDLTEDGLTLRKYIVMDMSATGIFVLLLGLTHLLARLRENLFHDLSNTILPMVPKFFFSAKFIFDCFVWFYIIYVLEFNCQWLIQDFQIAQIIMRLGILMFFIVIIIRTKMTSS